MPREHALTFHSIARVRRYDLDLAREWSGASGQSATQRPGEQHERAVIVATLEHVVGEYEILPEVEGSVPSAMHERHGALCDNLYAIERVALQEAAAVPTRSQPQPPVFSGDVRCALLQLRARRVAAPHRVLGDNADAAADGFRMEGARARLPGGRRVRR